MIPDHARAQLLYRLVGPAEELRQQITDRAGELAEVEFVLEIPFVRLRSLDGMPTMVAAFTTDIPALGNWGEPLLFGPGSIHVAHTEHEHVDKAATAPGGGVVCRHRAAADFLSSTQKLSPTNFHALGTLPRGVSQNCTLPASNTQDS